MNPALARPADEKIPTVEEMSSFVWLSSAPA